MSGTGNSRDLNKIAAQLEEVTEALRIQAKRMTADVVQSGKEFHEAFQKINSATHSMQNRLYILLDKVDKLAAQIKEAQK